MNEARKPRCDSSFTFPGLNTVFDCQNPPDQESERPAPRGRQSWTHLHGHWHYFEDVDGDGQRFRVEWKDAS
jgi:hypothetical protein